MKKKTTKPRGSHFNILRQICNLIPGPAVGKIGRQTGAENMSRGTTGAWIIPIFIISSENQNFCESAAAVIDRNYFDLRQA